MRFLPWAMASCWISVFSLVAGCSDDVCGDYPIERQCYLAIHLERSGWETDVRFSGSADGVPFSCTYSPDRPEGVCDAARVELQTWGPDLSLAFAARPRLVDLRIEGDGAVVLEERFRPDYETIEPEDEDCGVCTRAGFLRQLEPPAACREAGGCRCVRADQCGCAGDRLEGWAWTSCPAGWIPASACEPDRCACEEPPTWADCDTNCDYPWASGRSRPICSEGAWTCPADAPVPKPACRLQPDG